MKKLNLRLYRTIRSTLGQYIAVSLVIIVGIMSYIGLSTAMINLDKTVSNYYDLTNYAHIYVELNRIPENSLKFLYDIDGIFSIKGRIKKDVTFDGGREENATIRLISIPEDNDNTINRIYVKEGSSITRAKGALIIERFSSARDINIGDELDLQLSGKNYTLSIEGIASSSEFIYAVENEQTLLPDDEKFGVLFVGEEFLQRALGYNNSYNELLIRVTDKNKIDSIIDDLEKKLDKYGATKIISYENQLSNRMVHEEITQGKKSSSTVPFVFLIVAAIIIVVMIGKIVRNDRMAIGILKAMGYSNFDLLLHYTLYSLGIGIIGGGVGIFFGIKISDFFAQLYVDTTFDIPMLTGNFYYEYIIGGIILTLTLCIGAGIIGAKKVLDIHPADSMRPDPPKVGKKVFLEKFSFFWKSLSFSWKIVLKNILRSKRRFLFLVMGISLTFSITVIPLFQKVAMDEVFINHYSDFQRMDYNINFEYPTDRGSLVAIKELIDVSEIEGKIEFPFEIENRWKSKIIHIIGISRDTSFYYFKNLEGEKIILPREGMVISEGMANTLDIKKGDTIKVNTFIPTKDDKYVEIVDIVKQNLGANGYMNIEYMQKEFMEKRIFTGAYINTSDDVEKNLENMKNILNIQSSSDMMNGFKKYMNLFYMSVFFIILFSFILGFAIIYNSTIISINERRLEFSSLRVMGFTKNEIFKTVLYENIIMTIFGIIAGIPIASFMVKGIGNSLSNELYNLNVEMPVSVYIYSGILTVIFVIVSQLATYNKIHKLNFIDALKNRIS